MKLKLIFCSFIALLAVSVLTGCEEKTTKKEFMTTANDLIGEKVGVLAGGITSEQISKNYPKIKDFVFYSCVAEGIEAVKNNEVKAFVADYPMAALAISKNNDLTMLPENVCKDTYCFALKKGSPLTASISAVIKNLENNNLTFYLSKIWLGGDDSKKILPVQDWEGKNGVIRFAAVENVEPMSYIDSEGKITGYNLNLFYFIAKELDMKLEVTSTTVAENVDIVKKGGCDIAGGCLSATDERRKEVDLVEYFDGSLVFVVKKAMKNTLPQKSIVSEGNVKKEVYFSKISDLDGRTLGAITGGHLDLFFNKYYPKIESFKYYPTVEDAVIALKKGEIEGFVTDAPVAELWANKQDGLFVLPDKICIDNYAFAFKQESELKAKFEEVIKKFKSDGTLNELRKTWTAKESAQKVIPEQTWEGKNGTYKMCCNSILEPMCYKNADGNLTGHDIHLAILIAKELDIHIEFEALAFPLLIPSVQSGKYDICGGSLSETEERKQLVDMVTYFEGAPTIIVRTADNYAK